MKSKLGGFLLIILSVCCLFNNGLRTAGSHIKHL